MKVKIASVLLIAITAVYFLTTKNEVAVSSLETASETKAMEPVSHTENTITESTSPEVPEVEVSEVPEASESTDRIDSLQDHTEISIHVLETMKASELSVNEKMRILKKSLAKSSKIQGQNIIESVITSSSDPRLLEEAFFELARISSKTELREFFDRLEMMSTTEEKDQVIQKARSEHLR